MTSRTLLAHVLDRGLVGEGVAAVNRVVEVSPGAVALALEVLCGVDATLSADGVGTLDRNDGEEIHVAACLSDLDDGC